MSWLEVIVAVVSHGKIILLNRVRAVECVHVCNDVRWQLIDLDVVSRNILRREEHDALNHFKVARQVETSNVRFPVAKDRVSVTVVIKSYDDLTPPHLLNLSLMSRNFRHWAGMPRSPGYRPRAAVREEILQLRAQLAECDTSRWQTAQQLMDKITALLGHNGGPMRGKIMPRACRVCDRYGHTKQWCPELKRREEREMDRMLAEDERVRQQLAQRKELPPYDPRVDGQARTFNKLRMPFTIDPDLGPLVGLPGQNHQGMWTFDSSGQVVSRTPS